MMMNGGDVSTPLAMFGIVLFILAGFVSILIHELGHALTARKFGAHCEIVLQAFGGYAAYTGARMTRTQSFLITAAGPAIQIVLGLTVRAILPFVMSLQPGARYFLSVLAEISIFWALFNLLPIIPLDGGRLLDSILGPERRRITLWVTIVTCALMATFGLIYTRSIMMPVFFGAMGWQAWQSLHSRGF
jgi:Zn-dependent protease